MFSIQRKNSFKWKNTLQVYEFVFRDLEIFGMTYFFSSIYIGLIHHFNHHYLFIFHLFSLITTIIHFIYYN